MLVSLNIKDISNTFDKFETTAETKNVKQSFINVIDRKRSMLLCYGGVGNGKTLLCEASSIELHSRGECARVVTFSKLLSFLRSTINNPELNYDEVLNRYCVADRLIIDDIGAGGSDTEFGDKILETIVTARYGYEKLTIMTTNKNAEDLPERVYSRLQDKSICYLVENKGRDRRQEKAGK